jgi:peptide chain release factor subunit 3
MTISLNIGGTKPAVSGAVKDTKTAISKADAATSSAPASGTTTPTKSTTKAQASVSKAAAAALKEAKDRKETVGTRDFNFTMDRSKNDSDAIVKEQAIVADDQTLKELYGEEEDVVDTNGMSLTLPVFLWSGASLKHLQKKCT